MNKLNTDILEISIDDLDINKECKEFLHAINVKNLREFIDKGWACIKSDPEFDCLSFNKVILFLSERDLIHLMDI